MADGLDPSLVSQMPVKAGGKVQDVDDDDDEADAADGAAKQDSERSGC